VPNGIFYKRLQQQRRNNELLGIYGFSYFDRIRKSFAQTRGFNIEIIPQRSQFFFQQN